MNTNNLIQVHTLTDNSSCFFFKSFDDEKSFVITSKHSICDQRNSCDLYLSNTDGCCRVCPKEFNTNDIQLFNNDDTSALHIEKDRKSTRLNSSHVKISYAVFCF